MGRSRFDLADFTSFPVIVWHRKFCRAALELVVGTGRRSGLIEQPELQIDHKITERGTALEAEFIDVEPCHVVRRVADPDVIFVSVAYSVKVNVADTVPRQGITEVLELG